jgi:hypothetical protein
VIGQGGSRVLQQGEAIGTVRDHLAEEWMGNAVVEALILMVHQHPTGTIGRGERAGACASGEEEKMGGWKRWG